METVTLELPEHLVEEIKAHKDELPLILELGLERFARIAALGDEMFKSAAAKGEEVGQVPNEDLRTAEERFERMFGTVSLGYATGTDNESIDADLAHEYAGGLK